MSNFYDDSKFGVITRHWYGRTVKWGGETATGITFNETQGLEVARHEIRGPINLEKIGVLTLATLGKGEELFSLGVDGTATVKATIVASTASGTGAIASKTLATTVSAGSYLTLLSSTNVCSTGTVAVFFDWTPRFDSGGKWDVT